MGNLRQVTVCYTYKRTARGILLADPVAKRRTLFLVLFLTVCYTLSKVSGPKMNLKTGSSVSLFPQ